MAWWRDLLKTPAGRAGAIVTHLGSVLLCLWALYVQVAYRHPGQFVMILLPWVATALVALNLLLLVKDLVAQLPTDHPLQSAGVMAERGSNFVVRLFVCYSLLLYTNGKLDRSSAELKTSEVKEVIGQTIDVGRRASLRWVKLRSWDKPESTTYLLLKGRERWSVWAGQPVLVELHRGALRLPWVKTIEQNGEAYYRQILAIAPTASAAWKELVYFYIDHRRWPEALEATQRYSGVYPNDDDFVLDVAGALGTAGRPGDQVALIEPIVERRPSYVALNMLGWALSRVGDKTRAAAVIESSLPLSPSPDDVQAYYHLGYIYRDLGRVAEAIHMFEAVLERQPHFPEVETLLGELRRTSSARP